MTVPDKDFFTTAEVARLSGFSITAIQRSIDQKQVKTISLPGPGRHLIKITRAALIEFLKSMGHEIEDKK